MKPTVLLYNFTDSKRKMKVQQALMPLGFRLRAVKKEEYGLPVGVLAGVKGLDEDVLREAGGLLCPRNKGRNHGGDFYRVGARPRRSGR